MLTAQWLHGVLTAQRFDGMLAVVVVATGRLPVAVLVLTAGASPLIGIRKRRRQHYAE
jgi:hypothetical protein